MTTASGDKSRELPHLRNSARDDIDPAALDVTGEKGSAWAVPAALLAVLVDT